jgi:hypothetical protein
MLQMKYRTRIYYTEADKALMWDRWQRGESLRSIAAHFGRHHPRDTSAAATTLKKSADVGGAGEDLPQAHRRGIAARDCSGVRPSPLHGESGTAA